MSRNSVCTNENNIKAKQHQEPRPSLWKVWISAARVHTLTASLSPCLIGYSMTSKLLSFDCPNLKSLFFSWFLFCASIQIATNLHNDYADFVKGADTDKRLGQARATQKGWLSPNDTATAATVFIIAALTIAIPLVPVDGSDKVFWFVILSSCFNAFAYTGGPYPLGYLGLENISIAYWGLGDIFCFVYFGLVAALAIPYLALMEEEKDIFALFRYPTLLVQALPAAFLSTAIIVVNNLRDRNTDVSANKLTLAVRFGPTFCKVEYTLLVIAPYLVSLYNISTTSSLWHALPFLTVPLAKKTIKAMLTLDGSALNPFVGKTALLELIFCILQSIALLKQ